MANKTVPKRVKFEYYEVVLEVNDLALIELLQSLESGSPTKEQEEFISKLKKIQENTEAYSIRYDLNPLLQSANSHSVSQTVHIFDKLVELDVSTFLPMPDDAENNDVVYFQISNCRDFNIPSKKRIGQEREDIKLDDDEYIGEFMSIIYHKLKCAVMVQLNKYSLSISQLENFFTALRFEYLDSIGKLTAFEQIFRVALHPIIDKKALSNIKKQDKFTKFNIKCSDIALLPLAKNEKSSLYKLGQILEEFEGVNVELSLSVDARQKKEKELKLNAKEIREIYDSFCEIEDDTKKPNISVHYKDGTKTDVLNWLIPKMQNECTFHIEPRKTIGYEDMFHRMVDIFRDRLPTISNVLGYKPIKRDD
jgi:hypothetical protein